MQIRSKVTIITTIISTISRVPILVSDVKDVASKLDPSRVHAVRTHTVTGQELHRRVNSPEYLRSIKPLSRYLNVGSNNKFFSQHDLKRLEKLLEEDGDTEGGKRKKMMTSAFTVLTEGRQCFIFEDSIYFCA